MVRTAVEASGGTARFRDIEAVLAMARSAKRRGHLDLNGLEVEKEGWGIRFGKPPGAGEELVSERPLPVPGSVVTETGVAIQASIQRGPLTSIAGQPESSAALQADAVELPLKVRRRRPGDRIRPFGAPGTRKLQDLFVDRKVPRGERDRVPLVVDSAGRIVWVVGHAIADECRVTSPEAGMVILQVKKGSQ
jgi:tRNA(Ile)-lysidine synthase